MENSMVWSADAISTLRKLLADDARICEKQATYNLECKAAADAGKAEPPYPYEDGDDSSADRTRKIRALNEGYFQACLVLLRNKPEYKDKDGKTVNKWKIFTDTLGTGYFGLGFIREYYLRIVEKADLLGM